MVLNLELYGILSVGFGYFHTLVLSDVGVST